APALERGAWVISDRFTDATFAYQGGGRGLPRAKLEALEAWVHPALQPDMTLLFDVPLEVARQRLASSRAPDRFEREREAFFAATRREYLRRAAETPARFRIVDSTRPKEEVNAEIEDYVSSL
ncbi:MAG: dTMP kinase, partial [Burkholderiaceae bacterium]